MRLSRILDCSPRRGILFSFLSSACFLAFGLYPARAADSREAQSKTIEFPSPLSTATRCLGSLPFRLRRDHIP
jgi:hypothetical protein